MNGQEGERGDIPQSVIAIARQKATRVAERLQISRDEADDAFQSLLVRYLKARRAFDASKGSTEAFAHTVLNRAAANLLRDLQNAKHAPRGTVSLHVTVKLENDEYGELAGNVGQRELSARTGARSLDDQTAAELKLDVATILDTLPRVERELLLRLQTRSIAEVARDLGVPDTTIHSRLSKFRMLFEDAGLRDYLG